MAYTKPSFLRHFRPWTKKCECGLNKTFFFLLDDTANFDIKLSRATDNTYSTEDLSSTLKLGAMLYFKIELSSVRNDLKISPQSCYATNTRDSADRYFLIKDR